MRRWVLVTMAVIAAVAASLAAWRVGVAISSGLLPLEIVVVVALVGVALWLLARCTPTRWWALVLAVAAVHVVGIVRIATETRPELVVDRRGLDLVISTVAYLLVIAAGAVGAHRGSLRRSRERHDLPVSAPAL
jgi:hypothetical protein